MNSSTRALAVGLTDFLSGRNQALQYHGIEEVFAFYQEERIEKSAIDRRSEPLVFDGYQVKRGRSCCAISGCSSATPAITANPAEPKLALNKFGLRSVR